MSATARAAPLSAPRQARLPRWWPLAALTLLAAAIRLSTLDLQSLWYDEAFTVVRDFRPSLFTTLEHFAHTENTPPLWYVIEWAWIRAFGTGAFALRFPSAVAGIATVPVAWAIAKELSGRRVAILTAAIVAVNPLFVWYSQEARAYALFVLTASLALLCFVRAEREPSARRMALFALAGALALLSHYFAVFLLIGMCAWLLARARTRRAALPAVAALVAVAGALVPLVIEQGGHGTQWIGEWALASRLEAIPQYYLTGYSGAPLGHGIELLVALPMLAGLAFGVWRMWEPASTARARGEAAARALLTLARERRGLLLAVAIAAAGVLLPLVLALVGEDYLGPRNVVAAMIPVTLAVAIATASPSTARGGALLGAGIVAALLAITVDVDLSPRLQRGDWRGVANAIRGGGAAQVIAVVHLGQTPLEYYLSGTREAPPDGSVLMSRIAEVGYAPLRASARQPPVPGFHLARSLDVNGLIVYLFLAPRTRRVTVAQLRRNFMTSSQPDVLIAAGARVSG